MSHLPISYLLKNNYLQTIGTQLTYGAIATSNLISAPFLIFLAIKRKRIVQKYEINKSCCVITIGILNLIIVEELLLIIIVTFMFSAIAMVQFNYDSYSQFDEFLKSHKINISFLFAQSANLLLTMNEIQILWQIFEWAIMIHIIMFQDGKSISRQMYLMSNYNSREKFRQEEKRISYCMYSFMIFLIFLVVYPYIIVGFNLSIEFYYVLSFFRTLCLMILLLSSGLYLLKHLRKEY